jgi:hypothetical protein
MPFSEHNWTHVFNFNLHDNSLCVSRERVCGYEDGMFQFGTQGRISKREPISIGNSLENNSGGMGGFVGPEHEYFVYCGSKYAEIAIAKLTKKGRWEKCKGGHEFLAADNNGDEDRFFKNIWFMKKGLALIFEPKSQYRKDLMKDFNGQGNTCIKLNLSSGRCTGLTEEQFKEQRLSKLGTDSRWPAENHRYDAKL